MNRQEDMKEELVEGLNFIVNSGYFSHKEIEELAVEITSEILADYELDPPSYEEIQNIIAQIKVKEERTERNYERLRDVFDQLNRENIIALDFAGFDISEGHEAVGEVFQYMKENAIPRRGYCFYHQQDIERSMDPSIGSLYLAFHSMDGNEAAAIAVGKRVLALLKQTGFLCQWDGTVNQRICLQNFNWDKRFDTQDVGAERAIRMMRESRSS